MAVPQQHTCMVRLQTIMPLKNKYYNLTNWMSPVLEFETTKEFTITKQLRSRKHCTALSIRSSKAPYKSKQTLANGSFKYLEIINHKS